MNKILVLVLLAFPLFGAGTKFGDGPIPPALVYASLGSAASKAGYMYRVTDCATAACLTGGGDGSIQAIVFSTGSAWQATGSGGGGSGCSPLGTAGQILVDDGTGGCTAITTTGTGSGVKATSPTLVTPLLGTPTSGVMTNVTGLPLTTGVTGTLAVTNGGTGVTTSTGTGSTVRNTSPTLVTPILGTPTSGTLTNATGLPISTGVSGLGTGVATFLGTPTSANLISAVTNETGTGVLVFNDTPTILTPTIASFVNATHAHTAAASGGQITDAALSAAVTVPKGGCGTTTHTAYALIAGGTTSTGTCQSLASVGTAGQVLTSNGAGALPTWQAGGGGGGNVSTTSSATFGAFTYDFTASTLVFPAAAAGSGLTLTGGNILSVNSSTFLTRATDQAGTDKACVSVTGTDAYTCTLTPSLTGYGNNACFILSVDVQNTTGATLSIDSIGNLPILRRSGATLTTGDIPPNTPTLVCSNYNHTSWYLQF